MDKHPKRDIILIPIEYPPQKICIKLSQSEYLQFQEICKKKKKNGESMRDRIKKLVLDYIDENKHLVTKNRCISYNKGFLISIKSFMRKANLKKKNYDEEDSVTKITPHIIFDGIQRRDGTFQCMHKQCDKQCNFFGLENLFKDHLDKKHNITQPNLLRRKAIYV